MKESNEKPKEVQLIIRNSLGICEDLKIKQPLTCTVAELRQFIVQNYPKKEQITKNPKLIFAGKILSDDQVLENIFEHYDLNIPQTIHLIVKRNIKTTDTKQVPPQKSQLEESSSQHVTEQRIQEPQQQEQQQPQTQNTSNNQNTQNTPVPPMMPFFPPFPLSPFAIPPPYFPTNPYYNPYPTTPVTPEQQQQWIQQQIEYLQRLQQNISPTQTSTQPVRQTTPTTQHVQPNVQERREPPRPRAEQPRERPQQNDDRLIPAAVRSFLSDLFKIAMLALIVTSNQGSKKWFQMTLLFLTIYVFFKIVSSRIRIRVVTRVIRQQPQAPPPQPNVVNRQENREEIREENRQENREENRQETRLDNQQQPNIETLRRRNVGENNEEQSNQEQLNQEQLNQEQVPVQQANTQRRGIIGTLTYAIYLFFVSLAPNWEPPRREHVE